MADLWVDLCLAKRIVVIPDDLALPLAVAKHPAGTGKWLMLQSNDARTPNEEI